jgi:ankyrin repeat protein
MGSIHLRGARQYTPEEEIFYIIKNPKKSVEDLREFLKKAPQTLNVTDKNRRTPLMTAVLRKNKEKIKLLIKLGADQKMRGKYYCKAHDLAKMTNQEDIMNLLEEGEKNGK